MQGTAEPRLGGRASTVQVQGAVCEGGAGVGWDSWETSLGVGQSPVGIIPLLSVHNFSPASKLLTYHKAGSRNSSSSINSVSTCNYDLNIMDAQRF